MKVTSQPTQIAIVGGGPSGLFMYKQLINCGNTGLHITIYEKGNCLGCGMPYSHAGAADEHITNVSGNEIPELVTSVEQWIQNVSPDTLNKYRIDPASFNDYKVLPRLLFGQYLAHQFKLLLDLGKQKGFVTQVLYNSPVADIADRANDVQVEIFKEDGTSACYDRVIICSGHLWPKKHEGKVPGYFDSPYPPQKIALHANHPVAVRGSSLTAIDAVRTLARHNGEFSKGEDGILKFTANPQSEHFRIVMHSREGLLPAVRFHLQDTHLGKDTVLSPEEVQANRDANDGFLSLDYVFEQNFKAGIRANDPEFYEKIKDLDMEGFVDQVMGMRENMDPFELLKLEYAEAEQSIKRRESVYWKEMLAILSFAMNYPAKYFSAEDMLRLQKTLMPLISVVIAFVPQSSAETLLALHQADRLTMVAVGKESEVIPLDEGGVLYRYKNEQGEVIERQYPLFVDCIGQPHLNYDDLPYESLAQNNTTSRARLRFKDNGVGKELKREGNNNVVKFENGDYYLTVSGLAINDHFQVVDEFNALNERIYVMAVPFIGGYNPDYSGLDFCEAASVKIAERLFNTAVVA
ncbi:FAD/NAD(P)-binding protein [Mucilaginibacter terrae]|uniref:NAD(P)/FAD-binding protein YdhS n=1 Tax=Mucilaginibacter terrae TaxID=1955052 RepID=A0ABU3GZT5_9SPHI|nr:FAD/NAD(P)-binding protein [Mucilaginibacter terrae]MDT3405279.1 putative NAD(P)/FAD-binding protein YdhS [Mucilaginibacter terrae]